MGAIYEKQTIGHFKELTYFGPDLTPLRPPHLKPLIIAAVVSGLIIGLWIIGRLTFAFQFFRVGSSANEPTLKAGRMFFASNLKKPRRFDFICYRATTPERGAVIFTHRLCGLPGDLIEIRAGILYVNNQEADSKLALMHVYKVDIKDTATLLYDESLAYTLPPYPDTVYAPLEDRYVRSKNIPCIQYILPTGLRDEAIFKVYRQIWNQDHFGPVKVPAKKYFVLGDNRGNSMDSRYQGMIDQLQYAGTVWWK
jgi:signal peptidase I